MTLEEECTAFYGAIGEAISEWSHVEDALYFIFRGCLSPARHDIAAATFYAVENLRTKLQMLDAAMQLVFAGQPDAHKSEWRKILDAVRKKSLRRNELAHHQVLFDPKQKPGRRYLLRPAVMNPLSPSLFAANQGLHCAELRTRKLVFKALAKRITNFHASFGEHCMYYVPRDQYVRARGER